MKLSIIICVYNTDPVYLREALQSIAASTLRNYEICLVDDGSTLDYTELAAEFGARLLKTPNGGILRARLNGIEMAEGDYITFFDSDDTISLHYHQPMMEVAEREGAEIVINGWAFHSAGCRYYCYRDSTMASQLYAEGDDVLRVFAAQEGLEHSYYVTWNKIYSAHLLKGARQEILNSAIGDKNICYAEDALLNFYAFRDAKKLRSIHTGYYFYRMHANQSVNVISEARLRSQILAMGEVLGLMQAGIGDNVHREEINAGIEAWRAMIARSHYSHAAAGGYRALYPLLQSTYGVKKLRRSTYHDGAAYALVKLLPCNIVEIDAALSPLFDMQGRVEVSYSKRDEYVERILNVLRAKGLEVEQNVNAAIRIPKGKNAIRDIVLRNRVVWSVGTALFPKGSRIRAFLKRMF
ncbi:MAG: glycosyltransferase [Clostridia bacterium]|nr:glycosyltransferase [Clostridia bacterium]